MANSSKPIMQPLTIYYMLIGIFQPLKTQMFINQLRDMLLSYENAVVIPEEAAYSLHIKFSDTNQNPLYIDNILTRIIFRHIN